MAAGINHQVMPDGEVRLYDVAADGKQTIRELTGADGKKVAGMKGKTMAEVEKSRPQGEGA